MAGKIDEDEVVARVVPEAFDEGIDVDVGSWPLLDSQPFNEIDARVLGVPAVKGFGLVEVDNARGIAQLGEACCEGKAGKRFADSSLWGDEGDDGGALLSGHGVDAASL